MGRLWYGYMMQAFLSSNLSANHEDATTIDLNLDYASRHLKTKWNFYLTDGPRPANPKDGPWYIGTV